MEKTQFQLGATGLKIFMHHLDGETIFTDEIHCAGIIGKVRGEYVGADPLVWWEDGSLSLDEVRESCPKAFFEIQTPSSTPLTTEEITQKILDRREAEKRALAYRKEKAMDRDSRSWRAHRTQTGDQVDGGERVENHDALREERTGSSAQMRAPGSGSVISRAASCGVGVRLAARENPASF